MRRIVWPIAAVAAAVLFSLGLARVTFGPEKPPHEAATTGDEPDRLAADWETIRNWLAKPNGEGKQSLRFRFVQPGVILKPGVVTRPRLPENMTITITRHADDPAHIVVQQGESRWQIGEEQLDQLPEEIRRHVDRLLGPLQAAPGQGAVFDLVPWTLPEASTDSDTMLHEQLEEMSRQIGQLRHSMQQP